MPDYDFSGLCSRSFEHLVQALALKILGPNVTVFGDGPDGGREATFDGAVNYPSDRERWKGYGVIQAKFRQRPAHDATKDGQWALKELRPEVERFTAPEDNGEEAEQRSTMRRIPEYYIFATNVVLTPPKDAGSKDKALDLLTECVEKGPLEAFAIWDYEQICRYLDDCPEIRQAYAAWITPGDVLHQVMESLKPRRKDFEEVMSSFLEKELLGDQFTNLEQAGHTTEDRIPLARVFVDLQVSTERRITPSDGAEGEPEGGFVSKIVEAASVPLRPTAVQPDIAAGAPSERASIPDPGRFVLVGGPGQGKTTVSQFICQLFRAALLGPRQDLLTREAKDAFSTLTRQCEEIGIGIPGARRFPIRIELSEFAAALASENIPSVTSLPSYVAHRLGKRSAQDISTDDVYQWLKAYPWLVLLDGLDEVPASSNRDDVLTAIQDFWVDVGRCNADVLVVCTTRPQGYTDDFSPSYYQHFYLAPLAPAPALHYARRLVSERYGKDQNRERRIIQRLERASSQGATARLMQSPLQVTIMATLVDKFGHPPQERWRLFKEYYAVIYERERERDIPILSEILRRYDADIGAIHRNVGLLLQVESERTEKTEARLTEAQFDELVEDRLRSEGHKGSSLLNLKRQIIDAAAQRLVFLVGVEQGRVAFEIRSLQEFMAGEALMDGSDEQIRARLREIAPIANWRNVFLFAAGRCFADRQHLRETVHDICAQLNEPGGEPTSQDEVAAGVLGGSALAVDLLEDGGARSQPRYSQALTRLAMRVLRSPPGPLHARLAKLCDDNTLEVYRQELANGLNATPLLSQLGTWAIVATLANDGVDWALQMADDRWPEDHQDQMTLLEGLGQRFVGPWFAKRYIGACEHFPPWDPPAVDAALEPILKRQLPIPPWIQPPQHVSQPLEVSVIVPGSPGRPLSIRLLRCFGVNATRDFPVLSELPAKCPAGEAAARFIQDPSPKTLARSLSEMAAHIPLPSQDSLVLTVPWPLGACVDICRGPEDALHAARKADNGELGRSEDWALAERRWQKKGVTLDDFRHMTDDRLPFDKTIATNGFPVHSISTAFPIGSVVEQAQALLREYPGIPGSRARAIVGNWLSVQFFIIGMDPDGLRFPDPAALQSFLRTYMPTASCKNRVYPEVLNAIALDGLDYAEWVDTFNTLGTSRRLSSWWSAAEGARDLRNVVAKMLLRFQDRPGLVRLLAALPALDSPLELPANVLDTQRIDDATFNEAALIARLKHTPWTEQDVPALCYVLDTLLAQREGYAREAVTAATQAHVERAALNRFFLRVQEMLPPGEWAARAAVQRALEESAARARTSLARRTVWNELGLPEGIARLFLK